MSVRKGTIEVLLEAYKHGVVSVEDRWPRDIQCMSRMLFEHLFDEGVQIGELLDQCKIRRKNFAGRFESYVGHKPKAFLTIHRLDVAECLLLTTEMSITRIALAVGYGYPNTFSMAFRKEVGCTPTVFRSCGVI